MELELLRANLVRTLVPVLVGAVVTVVPLLADDQKQAAIYPIAAAAVTWLYYAAIRIAETRYPQLGRLLGRRMVQPTAATGETAGVTGTGTTGTGTGTRQPAATRAQDGAGRDHVELGRAGAGTGTDHGGTDGLAVRLGGVPVHGVESVELSAGEGRPTVLTLRIRDPRVELLQEDQTP